jgi:2-polyprenyl-3-methyl-5-hydroxy-6-metoxy-1,4-benzoquinol methylase
VSDRRRKLDVLSNNRLEHGKTMSWIEAWEDADTPWDAGASPPVLEQLVDDAVLPEGRALVPGCGSGYDVLTLAESNRHVTGADLAPKAAERFERLRDEAGVPADRVDVRVGDFFELDFDEPFDLIWDYTFLCALEPEWREDWADRCAELLSPGGQLVHLIFPVDDIDRPVSPDEEGPPYRLTPDFVSSLLEPRFERLERRPVDESHPDREGHEWLGRWKKP